MSSGLHESELGSPELIEVSPGVYAYIQPDGSWWINNTGLIVGSHGAVVIDTCATEKRTRAFREAIRSVTDLPIRTVVSTHHHGDHTHGNYQFREATIVANVKTRAAQIGAGILHDPPFWTPFDIGAVEMEPPSLVFDDGVTIYVDDMRCEVRHVGRPAHTTNDSIIWLPERSVLFAGDLLFNGGTPFILMGSLTGAIRVLTKYVAPLGAEVIVPGHGPVGGPELIDEVVDYLRFVLGVAERAHNAGLTPLEAAQQADLGRYAGWHDRERIVGNLHRAYAEIDGGAEGADIDVVAALADMVTYNGGQPLTCLA
ncbi:MAG TPA: MBL fold metallo-hydrolase [Acidimicrobiales bacterium]|nr:MBL fold metallo-hydrolase [Acidimicrobiales bacterium]